MALSSYAELQDAIIGYEMRDGDTKFAQHAPDFIRLTEVYLNRRLRVGAMETTAALTLTDGQAPLPNDHLETRSVVGAPVHGELRLITPAQAISAYGNNPGGIPRSFRIVGNTLSTYPSGSGTLTITYFASIPPLSDDNPSNWLLQRFPDAYLFGSLAQSAPFLMNDPHLQTWGSLFQTAIDDIIADDQSARYSRVVSRIEGATP